MYWWLYCTFLWIVWIGLLCFVPYSSAMGSFKFVLLYAWLFHFFFPLYSSRFSFHSAPFSCSPLCSSPSRSFFFRTRFSSVCPAHFRSYPLCSAPLLSKPPLFCSPCSFPVLSTLLLSAPFCLWHGGEYLFSLGLRIQLTALWLQGKTSSTYNSMPSSTKTLSNTIYLLVKKFN